MRTSKTILVSTLLLAFASSGAALAANSLSVTNAAAMGSSGGTACGGGECGLEIVFDGTSTIAKVVDNTPVDESIYRADFWIDFSNLTQSNGTFFVFMRATDTDLVRSAFQALVTRIFNIYRISGRAGTNTAGVFRITPRINIVDTCQALHLVIEREQSPVPATPDGEVTITVVESTGTGCPANGTFVNTTQFHGAGVNNSDVGVDDLHGGAVGNIGAGITGSMYFDEFSSFRTLAP